MIVQNDFDIKIVLEKPLMAFIGTVCGEGPRSSPVWFLFEDDLIWLFGTEDDSFVQRLRADPRCALSVVDFDLEAGLLLHAGIRGACMLEEVQEDRLKRFVGKYLGSDEATWNEWFVEQIVEPLDVMIRLTPETIVAKDVSYFKTGPNFASRDCAGGR
jgi:general stress protein 26